MGRFGQGDNMRDLNKTKNRIFRFSSFKILKIWDCIDNPLYGNKSCIFSKKQTAFKKVVIIGKKTNPFLEGAFIYFAFPKQN
jgi:hypothetical protein